MAAIQFTEATKAYPRTIAPAGKYPIVGDRIYRTLQDAQDYVDGKSSSKSAIPGIYLSVIADGTNNGAYWVEQAAGYDGATVGVLRKMGAGGGGDVSLSWNDITGKPAFAAVATSGSYNDLTDKPTIPDLSVLGALAYKDSLSWSEIVGRPTKLSDFTNDAGFITSAALAGYLKTEDAERIYITEEEAENRYVKRGGDSINGDISFGGSIKIGGATLSWDEASHALKVDTSFYSEKQLASGGIGDASGSGLGLVLSEWPTDSEDYSKYALGGNLGIELNTRLTAVERKATNVTVSPTLSQGKPMGTIMVDGVSQTMYAPSRLSQMDADFVDKNLLPYDDGACSLGSASRQWVVVFAEDFEASNSVTALLGEFGDINAQSGVFTNLDAQRLSVYSDFLPSNNNTANIGNSSLWWKNVYITSVRTRTVYGSNNLGLFTNGGYIELYDNNEDIDESIANFSYSGSRIYTDLTVDGALTVNGASVATQTWADGRYLKLSGGTIEGEYNAFSIKRNSSKGAYVEFKNNNGIIGYLGINSSGLPLILNADSTEKGVLIHSGSIGDYKAGDSAKLAGVNAVRYAVLYTTYLTSDTDANSITNPGFYINTTGNGSGNSNFPSTYGKLFSWGGTYGFTQMHADVVNKKLSFRCASTNLANAEWKTIAFTDSNVASATKLETARTIWGQSFDGTGNVKGHIYGSNKVFAIYGFDGTNNYNILDADTNNSNLWLGYGSAPKSYNTNICGNVIYLKYGTGRANGLILNSSGNVTIGGSDLAGTDYKLYVNGKIFAKEQIYACVGFILRTTDGNGIRASLSYASNTLYIQSGYNDGSNTAGSMMLSGTNTKDLALLDVRATKSVFNGRVDIGNSTSGTLKIGNAILSWDSANNALKIEGNVYATGQVAAGGVGTAVATIASDHEDRIAQLEAKVESLMS